MVWTRDDAMVMAAAAVAATVTRTTTTVIDFFSRQQTNERPCFMACPSFDKMVNTLHIQYATTKPFVTVYSTAKEGAC